MIRATIDARGVELRGHAGYAPRGQDIVCAAVSMLVYVQMRLLERAEELEELELRPGYVRMTLRQGGGADLRVMEIGLAYLAREYPACVKLV